MVRELYVKVEDPGPSWEKRLDLWYELAVEGIPLPQDFKESLEEEYQHLVGEAPARAPENVRAWEAYKSWVGDFVEDSRSPRERLEAYYLAQAEGV